MIELKGVSKEYGGSTVSEDRPDDRPGRTTVLIGRADPAVDAARVMIGSSGPTPARSRSTARS